MDEFGSDWHSHPFPSPLGSRGSRCRWKYKYHFTDLNESSLTTKRNSVSLTLSRRRKYLPTTRCGWHAAHCITAKYLFFTTWLTVSSPSVLIAPLRIRLAIPQMPVEGRRGSICTADFTGAFRPLYISFAVCKFLLFEIPAPAACSRARSD